jgi:hypothetical protein
MPSACSDLGQPIFQRRKVDGCRNGSPPIAVQSRLRVFKERRVLRDPDMAAVALAATGREWQAANLPSPFRPGAVTEEEAGAVELTVGIFLKRDLAIGVNEPTVQIAAQASPASITRLKLCG